MKKVPNNQEKVSEQLQEKFPKFNCTYDDGNVHVNFPEGFDFEVFKNEVLTYIQDNLPSRVGDGVQEGSYCFHGFNGEFEMID